MHVFSRVNCPRKRSTYACFRRWKWWCQVLPKKWLSLKTTYVTRFLGREHIRSHVTIRLFVGHNVTWDGWDDGWDWGDRREGPHRIIQFQEFLNMIDWIRSFCLTHESQLVTTCLIELCPSYQLDLTRSTPGQHSQK